MLEFRPWALLWWCAWCWCGAAAAGPWDALRQRSSFDVESTVELGAPPAPPAGYRLAATLHVALHARRLHFELESPRLLVRGKADYEPSASMWDEHPWSSFEADWDDGVITAVHLDPHDHPDILNYKKALVSLFQFQSSDGVYNETDVSGECEVLYETLADGDFRKIKLHCDGDGPPRADSEPRRVTRYGPALRAVRADESLPLGAPPAALRARSHHALRLAARHPPAAPPAPPPRAAHALALAAPPPPAPPAAAAAVSEHRAALEGDAAGAGGAADAAAALWHLLPALQAAPRAALLALFDRDELLAVRGGLCRALGLAGTGAAAGAARAALRLAAADAPEAAAREYLAGLALALAPQREALDAALELAREARSAPVASAALLAAAAAAPRVSPAAADLVRNFVWERLAACSDEECREEALRAIGNLRDPRDAAALLEQAERGGARAAPAALAALAAHEPDAPALRRLAALAADEARPLETRAAALDVAVTRGVRDSVLPLHLAALARALAEQAGAGELRRLLWQRVEALGARARPLLRALPGAARGWAARAAAGSSSAMRRAPGWAGAGWAARLDSLQLAQDGALRRGRVALGAAGASGAEAPLLAVEVRARGLAALAGGGGDPDESAGAELALEVGGAALPSVALFAGQAELLAHVWAGTGAEDTPVARALLPLVAAVEARALAGGAVVRVRRGAALALALDARADASLWRRTARARLSLRAGGAARAEAALRVQWAVLDAAAEARGATRLGVAADLDFYSGVSLCVRAVTAPLTRSERAAAGRGRGARGRAAEWRAEGHSLSLGRDNDATCRTLLSADDD